MPDATDAGSQSLRVTAANVSATPISAREATEHPDGLHDPDGVAAAYLTVAAVLRI